MPTFLNTMPYAKAQTIDGNSNLHVMRFLGLLLLRDLFDIVLFQELIN